VFQSGAVTPFKPFRKIEHPTLRVTVYFRINHPNRPWTIICFLADLAGKQGKKEKRKRYKTAHDA
jgi:hypothetical protein